MSVNCPKCGAAAENGQRFCTSCGQPLATAAPKEENKPEMDLSAYFNDPKPAQRPDSPAPAAPQPAHRPVTPVQVQWEPEKPAKSQKGLNIALIILGILAVAVITVVLLLLFWPSGNNPPAPAPTTSAPPTVEPTQAYTPTAAPDGGTQAPVVIITPSPVPAPTTAPTPSPTPTPDPASEYLLPESNTRYLTESDLSGLTHEQLCFARNEIFARHGRIFQTPQIAAYFNAKSWYNGTLTAAEFKESVFNKYEVANIKFISEYEKKYYGGSYY